MLYAAIRYKKEIYYDSFIRTLTAAALTYRNKKTLIVIITVVAALVIDASLIRISDFMTGQTNSFLRVTVFFTIGAICAIGQGLVLRFVKQKIKMAENMTNLHFRVIHKIVTVVQYILPAIFVLVTLQIIVTSHYDTILVALTMTFSYTLSLIMMAVLAKRFLAWFKLNRNSLVLFYGLASLALALNALLTIILLFTISPYIPKEVGGHYGPISSSFAQSRDLPVINYAFVLSSIVSFSLLWIATVLLLNHYSQRFGKLRYWIIVSIPLTYFLSQFVALFLNLFLPLLRLDPIFFSILLTFIYTLSKPIAGILFGVAIWTTAKNIRHNDILKNHMIISAYGFVLLFVSNQVLSYQALVFVPHPLSYWFGLVSNSAYGFVLLFVSNQALVFVPHPPFGLATTFFVGLSSYLILVGIYHSAISVAQDIKLRQSIRKFALKESKLLDSIGTSQMEQEIRQRVIRILRESQDIMNQQNEVKSSLNKDEIDQYLDEVLKEVKDSKSREV
jgi:hypothetical protein